MKPYTILKEKSFALQVGEKRQGEEFGRHFCFMLISMKFFSGKGGPWCYQMNFLTFFFGVFLKWQDLLVVRYYSYKTLEYSL